MDAAAALTLIAQAVTTFNQVEPILAQGWTDIKPFATALYTKYTGGTISDADLAALETQIDELNAEFMTPLPPE